MATGYEKFERQLDRLEKLFSRKKRVAYAQKPAVAGTNVDATARSFPVPPYLRPTSSRMMAREEVLLPPHSARRARSLPETPSTPHLRAAACRAHDSDDKYPSIPTRHCSSFPGMAQRSSSPYSGSRTDDPSSKLLEFSFSAASKGSKCESSPTRRCRPSSRLSNRSSVSVSPRARPDRKRYSTEFQDQSLLSERQESEVCKQITRQERASALPPLAREDHSSGVALAESPTPYLSPSPLPKDEPKFERSSSDRRVDSHQRSSSPISHTSIHQLIKALHKSTSVSQLSLAKDVDSDPVLKEPTVHDFLALSDDDIADGHAASRVQPPVSNPPAFALPPNPSLASSPVRIKPTFPLLTLSPPMATLPAAAAAIEAARIATKYRFNLVYVVNLWPNHISRSGRSSPLGRFCSNTHPASPFQTVTPSPPGSPVSTSSGYNSSFESRTPISCDSGTTGRLLAAYGLSSIMCPFRISAPVHQKVLRTQGWLEYRNDTGARDEFAHGYSCSFYTGYTPPRGCTTDVSNTEGKHQHQQEGQPHPEKPANRGIVFAAFRVPSDDGKPLCSDIAELEELHKDAEALVDMLINNRTARRQRRLPTPPSRWCVGGGSSQMLKSTAPLVAI
ncbi:hypothetical protein P885DRAFT_80993 [Corynascus similis CBS 632.67]